MSENTFFNFNELNQLHIELTNACNAACPMCTRFHMNSPTIRPDLQIAQITLEQFKKWFPPYVIQKLEVVLFCGVHGDPGMAKDLYEICEYIGESSEKTSVRINTNGGMRKPEFWERMGKLFSSKFNAKITWQVTWSIDGLEDTNHLYRRNVEWDKLMANVKAYIGAGGRAEWDYLIFGHNEHQIDEAKDLSKKLGFASFVPKKSLGVDNGTRLLRMPAINREGKLEYWIDPPKLPENRNLPEATFDNIIEQYWSFRPEDVKQLRDDNYKTYNDYPNLIKKAYEVLAKEDNSKLDSSTIDCKAKTRRGGKEIFVDQKGRVIACCYMGTHLNGVHSDGQSLQLHYELEKYGWDKFDLNLHSLEEIMNAHHLDNVFTESWTKPSCVEGKMAYCANICGTYSRVDRIYTHEKMDDKSRNWRMMDKMKNEKIIPINQETKPS
jgi:MoaA/NifB/PqqE/SkfB family radical SAM enzyme